MKALNTYPLTAKPFAVIENRISAALAVDKLLYGVTYDREARLEPLGADMLPFIQPVNASYSEKIFAGGHNNQNNPNYTHWNTVADGRVSLLVAGRREYGLVQRSTGDAEDGKGILEWIARLQDAIELDATGLVDPFLEGSLSRPVAFSIQNNYISDLSFVLLLDVSFQTNIFLRGQRTP